MDAEEQLFALIKSYQRCVAGAVSLVERHKGWPKPSYACEWMDRAYRTGAEQSEYLAPDKSNRYWLHGYGCLVWFYNGCCVNWDFGEQGETDGFEAFWLFQYAEQFPGRFPALNSRASVREAIIAAEAKGLVRFSGHILYYVTGSANKTEEAQTESPEPKYEPDEFFTAEQHERQRDLMRRRGSLSAEEWSELEALVDAELEATMERAKARFCQHN